VTGLGIVARDEVVEVAALERIFFEREVFVGAQIVNPELICPGFFSGRFAVEEEDVGLDALRVEDAGLRSRTASRSKLGAETGDGHVLRDGIVRNEHIFPWFTAILARVFRRVFTPREG